MQCRKTVFTNTKSRGSRTVCSELPSNLFAFAKQSLEGLELADDFDNFDNTESIDVLIGSNYYWDFVSGDSIKDNQGLTAVYSKFGWLLSRPIHNQSFNLIYFNYRLRKLIPAKAKLQLFKAAILPYLTYCSIVWNCCKASDSRKLERVQERALRAVYCDSISSYSDLLKRANLKTLRNRRLHDIAVLMFKVKNDLCPNNIKNLFVINNNKYNLRNND